MTESTPRHPTGLPDPHEYRMVLRKSVMHCGFGKVALVSSTEPAKHAYDSEEPPEFVDIVDRCPKTTFS